MLYHTEWYKEFILSIYGNSEIIVERDKIFHFEEAFIFNPSGKNIEADILIVNYLIVTGILEETGGNETTEHLITTYKLDYSVQGIINYMAKDLRWNLPVQGDTIDIVYDGVRFEKFVANVFYDKVVTQLYIILTDFKKNKRYYIPIADIDKKKLKFQTTRMVLTEKFVPSRWNVLESKRIDIIL